MSSIPRQLATFVAVLAVLYAGGAIVGQLIDDGTASHGNAAHTPVDDTEMRSTGRSTDAKPQAVRGPAVADKGLRIVVEEAELERGRDEGLRLRIVDASGQPVRDFDVEHTKRMHAIVVRRDLTGFQHLHPEVDGEGTWTTTARLDHAGSYRLFADFSHGGQAQTLASDLRVDGSADLRALPEPESTATSDGGYRVRLDAGEAKAGDEAQLRFAISRTGRPVRTEPYLGAGGHLVALREGDLAFLHVHPTEARHGEPQAVPGGDDEPVAFAATFPTKGRYRLFLQFQHEGRVQTVAFTQEVR